MQTKAIFLEFRRKLAHSATLAYDIYYKGSKLQEDAVLKNAKTMNTRLQDRTDLCERLIPSYEVGCRRLTPGSGYLEALTAKNSTCVFDPIDRISKSGIVTKDGREHKLDAIICATGCDVSFRPAFPITGRHNKDLRDFWKDTPTHYLSVAVPGFPNYFIIGGPNSPISNGSLIYGLEAAIDYAFSCIKKLQEESIARLTVKIEPTEEFLEHRDALMQRMV
ncbi:hypothetical protein DM02DRAFT_685009 [Periconia macrospinosa]|uniref:FAD/NAD(P)-binding domain-containing protein n=1 Tax=Periconia macrospinosa TaxID=97972 RepID=A0A2V1DGZ8_9PLEO|nr:hypothetical protein DM02DRAFT_685009 [Periconia macrospinosa]